MSKALKWLEADRLEKECDKNVDPYKTVNHSFLDGFNYALANIQMSEEIELNDNQKIVLEYLKEKYQETDSKVFLPFWTLKNNSVLSWRREEQLYAVYIKMSGEQQFEILAAFAAWGLEQEETE
ncbi:MULTISPECIES: hypothetical protein [Enterococcus]|uniref:Phage ABA sandwich domain-containing protein n=1 Tax=Candidatus Enterococcus mangumiae TaxID=2230878 RepID=A0ABZ2SX64_9ENTE|nr:MULTISPECIES: hypothetical protein [unclassified Enterococcus]MBO0490349.1 hypothetical protein [Enterococcus sp. DIV1094]MBO1298938.1 hypothetical protein [Enterococcus sp. DIV1271a]